jgi:hypothetical protein
MILPVQPQLAIKERLPQRIQFLTPFLAMAAKPLVMLRIRGLLKKTLQPAFKSASWQAVEQLVLNQNIRFPHILHDSSFLQWRCNGLPGFSPKLESVSLDTGAFAVFQATPSQFFVYEWKAENLTDTRFLFEHIVRLCLERNSQTILVYANSNNEELWLHKLGFFMRRTPTKVIYYPHTLLGKYSYFHYCLYDSDGNI